MKTLKIISAVLGITASTGGCGIVAKTIVTIAAPSLFVSQFTSAWPN
jgi:hypothetical protein